MMRRCLMTETFWLACMALKRESMGLPGLLNILLMAISFSSMTRVIEEVQVAVT